MQQFDDINNINVDSSSTYKPPSLFQMNFEKMIKDMRFVGMFSIIYGAITCLTIIGALLGVPTIIVGLKMREAADQFAIFKATNDAASMRIGFELQGQYFKIVKILLIIGLVLTVIYFIAIILLFASGFGALMEMENYSS
ncbi:MAG: DUF5362 domain-containing protein [Ignavibacteriales bacterium]|nr:DUF5362 domain-containing protein [Ignavibacteriales bacterium]